MEIIHFLIELLTNTKEIILGLTSQYPNWIYGILFLIIFVETGLVIMPFLPGDSLLFTVGMICATAASGLNIAIVIPLLIFAAVLGDNVNYFVGKFFSEKMLSIKFKAKPIVKQEWIDQVHEYFEKHGTKTIIIARFMPIVRTITPFVTGIGKMNYTTFLPYDILGGVLWVGSITTIGYFLGNNQFVEDNLEKFILGIVFISVLPMLIKGVQSVLQKKKK
ncbi:MAG: VTT domain-containing protein [Chitinophagales bacterium]|nr:VTT domain-containing protein [Chitinophagales bacterium]